MSLLRRIVMRRPLLPSLSVTSSTTPIAHQLRNVLRERALHVSATSAAPREWNGVAIFDQDDYGANVQQSDLPRAYPPEHVGQRRQAWEVAEVLKLSRSTKITTGGRLFSYNALMIIGDGKGTAGYGYGKGPLPQNAVAKAMRDAEKNLISIPLMNGRTIPYGFKVKQDGCKMVVTTRGYKRGTRTARHLMLMCQAIGLQDVAVKTFGNRNVQNVVRAFFKGLYDNCVGASARHEHEKLGKKLYNPQRVYRHRPQPSNAGRV